MELVNDLLKVLVTLDKGAICVIHERRDQLIKYTVYNLASGKSLVERTITIDDYLSIIQEINGNKMGLTRSGLERV